MFNQIQQHQLTIDTHDVVVPWVIRRVGLVLHCAGQGIQHFLIGQLLLLVFLGKFFITSLGSCLLL